jgi:flagellar export protein FliJ
VKTFKFRAQAALDLRQRQLEEAQRQLARTEALRDAARRRLQQADDEAARARTQAADAHRTATDVTALQWYRFWILRLDHERAAHAAALASREHDVTQAAAACMRAKQRRESLDRFRKKAQAAHDKAELAAEMKVIDELATRRYVRTSATSGSAAADIKETM